MREEVEEGEGVEAAALIDDDNDDDDFRMLALPRCRRLCVWRWCGDAGAERHRPLVEATRRGMASIVREREEERKSEIEQKK